jgi:hypothetical protein
MGIIISLIVVSSPLWDIQEEIKGLYARGMVERLLYPVTSAIVISISE